MNFAGKPAGFSTTLLPKPRKGRLPSTIFTGARFNDQIIRSFGLGYSPHSWDAFLKFAAEKKFPAALLVKTGLARRREDGTTFDYFRGRAMFPIFSSTGRVAGFGARKIREDDPLAKYINSPESLIYNKSRLLYGLYQAKEEIRQHDFAILVEGYADLISLFSGRIQECRRVERHIPHDRTNQPARQVHQECHYRL